MGSTEQSQDKGIDASVGGLVWVRRRNGSWWPGQIVSLNDLPESCSVSPTAGTPVRLLGRDDVDLDWHDLETSKTIKPFQCGEYDEDIEKAKVAVAYSKKKGIRHTQREGAIISALEIESAHIHNSSGECGGSMPHSTRRLRNKAYCVRNCTSKLASALEVSQSGRVNVSEQKARRRTPFDSEDDGTERVERMRGLEDLGMGVGSKGKVRAALSHEQDTALLCDSNGVPKSSHVNGNRGSSPSLKRKIPPPDQEIGKRKCRHKKMVNLMGSASVPVISDRLASSNGSTALQGIYDSETESDKSDETTTPCENSLPVNPSKHVSDVFWPTDEAKNNGLSNLYGFPEVDSSDMLYDVPLIVDETYSSGCNYLFSGSLEVGVLEILEFAGLDESGNSKESSHEIGRRASNWLLKGKRNSGHVRKNMNVDEEPDQSALVAKSISQWGTHTIAPEAKLFPEFLQSTQMPPPYRQSRFKVDLRSAKPDLPTRPNNRLYIVKLDVEDTYQTNHVPMVSLMSTSNGKAIYGHPIIVEVLVDGGSDLMLSNMKDNVPAVKHRSNYLVKNVKVRRGSARRKSSKSRFSISLPKKVKKLSSLTGQKPRERDSTLSACIRLKQVFSRISEALN